MNEEQYITHVKNILTNVRDPVHALEQVATLQAPKKSPSNIAPFIVDLPQELEWNGDYVYEYLHGQEFADAQSAAAASLLERLRVYVGDYENGNWYTYTYAAVAKYEGTYEIYLEKVDLAAEQETESFSEAEATAMKLQQSLPDRFFVVSERDGPLKPGNYRLVAFGVRGYLRDKHGIQKSETYHSVYSAKW